jgi:hypothetical protein
LQLAIHVAAALWYFLSVTAPSLDYAPAKRPRRRWILVALTVLFVAGAAILARKYGRTAWQQCQLLQFQRRTGIAPPPPDQIVFSDRFDDYQSLPARPPQPAGRYEASYGPTAHNPTLWPPGCCYYATWIPDAWWPFAPAFTNGSNGDCFLLIRTLHRADGTPRVVVLRFDEGLYYNYRVPVVYAQLSAPATLTSPPRFITQSTPEWLRHGLYTRILAGYLDPADRSHLIVPFILFAQGDWLPGNKSFKLNRASGTIHIRLSPDDDVTIRIDSPGHDDFKPTEETAPY